MCQKERLQVKVQTLLPGGRGDFRDPNADILGGAVWSRQSISFFISLHLGALVSDTDVTLACMSVRDTHKEIGCMPEIHIHMNTFMYAWDRERGK